MNPDLDQHRDVVAALHGAVDDLPLAGDGWRAITARLEAPAPLRSRRWLVTVAAAASAVAVAAGVVVLVGASPHPGPSSSVSQFATRPDGSPQPLVWPGLQAPADVPTWQQEPLSTAARFVASLGLPVDSLSTSLDGDGQVVVRQGGRTLTSVTVAQYPGSQAWGVLGATSEHLAIRSPESGARLDPPLAVSYTSDAGDLSVLVSVHRTGEQAPVGSATEERIDAETVWTTSVNVPARSGEARGFLTLVTTDPEGRVRAVAARPLFLGTT